MSRKYLCGLFMTMIVLSSCGQNPEGTGAKENSSFSVETKSSLDSESTDAAKLESEENSLVKNQEILQEELHQELTGIWETEDQQMIYLFKEDSYSSIMMSNVRGVTGFLDYIAPYAPYTIEGINTNTANLSLDILINDEIFDKKYTHTYIFSPDKHTAIRKTSTGEEPLRYLGEMEEMSTIMEPRLGFVFPENVPTVQRGLLEFLNNDEFWGDFGNAEFNPEMGVSYFVRDAGMTQMMQALSTGTGTVDTQSLWVKMTKELQGVTETYQSQDGTVQLTILYRSLENSEEEKVAAIIKNGQVLDMLEGEY